MGYKCQFGCETNNLNSPQPFPSAIPNYLDQEWQSLGAGQSLLTDTWWIWTHLSKEKHSRVIPESHVAVLFLFFSLKMCFRKSCPILFFLNHTTWTSSVWMMEEKEHFWIWECHHQENELLDELTLQPSITHTVRLHAHTWKPTPHSLSPTLYWPGLVNRAGCVRISLPQHKAEFPLRIGERESETVFVYAKVK